MKKLLSSIILLATVLTMSAVPAKRVWKSVHQADGTQVTLMLVGDENCHFYRTTDGLPVLEEQGNYYYATVEGENLKITNQLAHNVEQRSALELQAIADLPSQERLAEAMRKAPRVTQPRFVGEPIGDLTGSKKGLIILVQFSDLSFYSDDPMATWNDIVNTVGYRNNYGAIGSVHDYFLKQSNGLFDLTFDVVGPYTAPKSVTYYGANRGGGDNPQTVREFIRYAISAANDDVDYQDYDWDNDGEVDQVFILYAGYGEAGGAPSYTIWPHESHLGSYAMSFDGMTIDTYACSEELSGDGDGADDPTYVPMLSGLGTICHEFSHCLGLPDFYDTASNSALVEGQYGMGFWDLMDAGCYNYNGWVPSNYSGYERKFCGWADYRKLTDPCKVTGLKSVDSGGETYVIYNPGNNNEYYLLENRYKAGWDKGLEGEGLLIYHVNYIPARWMWNTVNTSGSGNPCFNPVPADRVLSVYIYNSNGDPVGYGDAGDAWPTFVTDKDTGKKINNNTLSDTSIPACTLYNPNTDGSYLLHAKVRVSKRGGVIDFVYNDGKTEWSDASTGIMEIGLDSKGDVYGKRADIYTTNGILLMRTDSFSGNEHLPQGLYIVRTTDGQSIKVSFPAK
ncbi:MAG: M6 family metalloprotease domain-containing protein [Prevotella sp.]|nr:M6 family metalloprotease domain-containing protein [Prevotella sp.]